jgi:hypothetical protein
VFGTTELPEKPIMLPPFVDSTHCLPYHLTKKGRAVADRVVSVLGYACPDITYSPSLYPITAILLHFMSGKSASRRGPSHEKPINDSKYRMTRARDRMSHHYSSPTSAANVNQNRNWAEKNLAKMCFEGEDLLMATILASFSGDSRVFVVDFGGSLLEGENAEW